MSRVDLNRVTGIFAANDAIAIGALKALEARQVPIPEGVALVGVDDIAAAQYVKPSLTTIRHDMDAEGRHAASELLQALEARRNDSPPTIRVVLVARESS